MASNHNTRLALVIQMQDISRDNFQQMPSAIIFLIFHKNLVDCDVTCKQGPSSHPDLDLASWQALRSLLGTCSGLVTLIGKATDKVGFDNPDK